MADFIGWVAGLGLTVLPFLAQLPDQSKVARTTVVRIGVGTSVQSNDSTGGNIPGLNIWDVAGRYISGAYGSDSNIGDGEYKDIDLLALEEVGSRQMQYISISAGGNDAICISYIVVSLPDGNKWSWVGDVGQACNGPWYNSQTISNNEGSQPKCLWIDGDGMSGTGPNGIWTQGFSMHITDFIPSNERVYAYNASTRIMCESWPRFHMYDKLTTDDCIPYFDPPLEYNANLTDQDISKVMVAGTMTTEGCHVDPQPNTDLSAYRRNAKSRRQSTQGSGFNGRLITSSHPSHSAIELCESGTSVGPDFVAHYESMYCDMETKQAYLLCDAINIDNCFNINNYTLVPSKRIGARDEALVARKVYHTVTHW